MALVATYFLVVHAFPKLVVSEAVYGEYYWGRRYWLLLHVVFGLVATVAGPFQFSAALRRSRPRVHRIIGRAYLVSVFVSAMMALYLAATSAITPVYTAGLCVVAGVWIATGAVALAHALRRTFTAHREWMVRNYVVTFFFILFFAYFDLFTLLKIGSMEQLASIGVWLCWVLPLGVTEVLLHRRRVRV
jgi:hypothetical protein